MFQYSGGSILLATGLYHFLLFKNKDKMASILEKWGYLHNERVFCCKVLSFFITHQDLSLGGFALKIEFVLFVYELFIYEIFLILGYVINTLECTHYAIYEF